MMRILVMGLSFLLAAGAWAKSREAERIFDAADVFKQIMNAPDRSIPQDFLRRAQCVTVIPSMFKAAFIFGGQHGKGVVVCRREDGGWGAPSMLTLSGGSFGLQIGGQGVDVIMLIMTRRGIDYLTRDKFVVGGDLSAAAGPVGREVTAGTDVKLVAEIYTYSRARGLFAGISLKGAVVRPDNDGNRRLYGHPVIARELLLEGKEQPPSDAAPLMTALGKYGEAQKAEAQK